MFSKIPARTKALAKNACDIVCNMLFVKKTLFLPPLTYNTPCSTVVRIPHDEHNGDWIFLLTCFTTGRCTMKKASPCAALAGFSVHRMHVVAAQRLHLHKC
jgi:hypothetical protein